MPDKNEHGVGEYVESIRNALSGLNYVMSLPISEDEGGGVKLIFSERRYKLSVLVFATDEAYAGLLREDAEPVEWHGTRGEMQADDFAALKDLTCGVAAV